MKVGKLFEKWGMTGLTLNLGFVQSEWKPQVQDMEAAWEMYVELLTRIATQPLPDEAGVEKTALESVYSLFATTRTILRKYGKESIGFAKIAIIILNQVLRPFTTRWHALSQDNGFDDIERAALFRKELSELQVLLHGYMGMLSNIAGVEDISPITQAPEKSGIGA